MGLVRWFWRLFFVFAGLIVAHVLIVGLLLQGTAAATPAAGQVWWRVWLVSGLVIVAGGLAVGYCLWRIVQPVTALTQRAFAASQGSLGPLPQSGTEVDVLAGALRQMERDLDRRVAQIQRSHQQLETVLASMAEGVLAVAADHSVLLANEAARRLLDFVAPRPVGRPLLEVTRARPVYEAVTEAQSTDRPVVKEFDTPGPVRRRLSLRAARLPGTPSGGVVVVLHDMTELRRLENARRELVANVSHELKTPLAAIKGYAETLRMGAIHDPDYNLHFVERIEEQAERLHQLIVDMLQLARVEAGEETFELAGVPVHDLSEQCAADFAKSAAARQLQLTTETDAPAVAWADEEGVRTILANLIDNAIKYTPAGGTIVVRTRVEGPRVVVEVQDSGIGIAEHEQERIFERFYRVDRGRSRELGGTGLGLSIVKHLVQALGGQVGVKSQPGRGSTFRVELPLSPPGALSAKQRLLGDPPEHQQAHHQQQACGQDRRQ